MSRFAGRLRAPFVLLLTTVTLAVGGISADAANASPSPSASPSPRAAAAAQAKPGAKAPAAALAQSITLSASQVALAPGGSTVLTATTSQPVTPGLSIQIFDTTGILINACPGTSSTPTTTCVATNIKRDIATIVDYAAFVATTDPDWPFPPNGIQATSNAVEVSWLTVSLTPFPKIAPVGSQVVLNAISRADVGGPTGQSPFHLQIFDVTAGTRVADCAFGLACSAKVTQTASTVHQYQAFVAKAGTTLPLPDLRGSSPSVPVTWATVDIQCVSCPIISPSGSSVTLTATASFDVQPTPFFIQIFDVTTGVRLASCPAGTTCTVTTSQLGPTTHEFVAFVSDSSATFPPTFFLTSIIRPVTWS